jgi:hypothetical protein
LKKIYFYYFKHWGLLLLSKSYWHKEQAVGRFFSPLRLDGYFNDLTQKTKWPGITDKNGMPLVKTLSGRYIYNPVTIFQKALGHWDIWIGSNRQDKVQYKEFLNVADWALNTMDGNGGWPVWPKILKDSISQYSAMAQGQGISVLVRAFSATGKKEYLKSAERSLGLLLKDAYEGGTSRRADRGLIFEELPLRKPNTILNGYIFALFGLYDFILTKNERFVKSALDNSLNALADSIAKYNAGFWSFYDSAGNLASPFYHKLHIAQLKGLEMAFPENHSEFTKTRVIFEKQYSNYFNRLRAVTIKVFQKILNPPKKY